MADISPKIHPPHHPLLGRGLLRVLPTPRDLDHIWLRHMGYVSAWEFWVEGVYWGVQGSVTYRKLCDLNIVNYAVKIFVLLWMKVIDVADEFAQISRCKLYSCGLDLLGPIFCIDWNSTRQPLKVSAIRWKQAVYNPWVECPAQLFLCRVSPGQQHLSHNSLKNHATLETRAKS